MSNIFNETIISNPLNITGKDSNKSRSEDSKNKSYKILKIDERISLFYNFETVIKNEPITKQLT
jgi:hypothetical protein